MRTASEKQLLIGGAALEKLGSDRKTEDTDYLICVAGKPVFSFDKSKNTDYINAAAGNRFFAEIWKMEEKNQGEMASPAALLELKAYALVQHCLNGVWKKADDCEHDMRFLMREYNLGLPKIVKKHVHAGGWLEIERVYQNLRR
jgi:hypothetical protein